MMSLMDGFASYNQIMIVKDDHHKTSFQWELHTYCYRIMSFGLKNARVTYQHVVTSTFHNLINIIIQIYVNYLITKSRHHVDHLVYLWVILEHLICYKIHLKLAKLLFGVWKTP